MHFHFYLVFITKVAAMFGFLSKETAPYPLSASKKVKEETLHAPCCLLGVFCLFVVLWFGLGVVGFFCKLTKFSNNKIRLEA